MKDLEEKHLDTSRGFHYRYYTSPASSSQSAPDNKPTLLLCHGFPDGAELWQFVIPHLLKSNLRIIVPDLLGYGGTSKPTDPKDFEVGGMAADVMEILKEEGAEGGIIPVGHDWGSYLAQRFYMLHSDRCAGLITVSVALMAPRGDPFNLDNFNNYTEQAVGYPLYAYWELFLPHEGVELMDQRLESMWYAMHADVEDWMKKMFCVRGAMKEFISQDRQDVPLKSFAKKDGELMKQWIEGMKEGGGFMSPTCWYRAIAGDHNMETEKVLNPKIEKPYLFIGCDGDAVCRTDFIELSKKAGLVPNLVVEELKSGHWCPYEKPEEVADAMMRWLEGKGFLGE